MDTAPAPPPRIEFGSWSAKNPTEKENEENNGPTMVSQSLYKPITGQFPSISSLWGCTEHSEHDITRRAPQGARGNSNTNVNKPRKTASIAGPTRQRPGGVTGTKRPAKAVGNWHVVSNAQKGFHGTAPTGMQRSLTVSAPVNSPFPDPEVSLRKNATDRNAVYSSCRRPAGISGKKQPAKTAGSGRIYRDA